MGGLTLLEELGVLGIGMKRPIQTSLISDLERLFTRRGDIDFISGGQISFTDSKNGIQIEALPGFLRTELDDSGLLRPFSGFHLLLLRLGFGVLSGLLFGLLPA